METQPDKKDTLKVRKRPSQERSRIMVGRILDATRELLKNSGHQDAPRLNTNVIAKQAEISVGSLYRYFPNLESVLYELYQEIIGNVIDVLNEFDSAARLSLPRKEFFAQLTRSTLDAEADQEVIFAMQQAMKTYPVLQKMEKQHAEKVATIMAGFLKYYGSKWPQDKLERLASYVYYINYGTWVYRDHIRPPVDELTQWELSAMSQILEQCFED